MLNILFLGAYISIVVLGALFFMKWIPASLGKKYNTALKIGDDMLAPAGTIIALVLVFLVLLRFFNEHPLLLLLFPSVLAAMGLAIYAFYDRRLKQTERYQKYLINSEISSCLEIIARDPGNAAIHERLGEIYEKQGLLEKALDEYKMVYQLDPSTRTRWHVETFEKAKLSDRQNKKK